MSIDTGRVKGRYVAQIIVDINMLYRKSPDRSMADVKERFRKMLTPMIEAELQDQMGSDGKVIVNEQLLDVYEVTE